MFYLCQQTKKKKKSFWNHWRNLLASTKPSVTSQRLRTSDLWMKCSVCTVGSDTDTRKHVGQAEFVKLRLYLLPFPTPSSQTAHQIYIILCWPSSIITSCDINHTAWALSMQGNTAKGDSDQIFYLQINSLPRSLPLPLSLLPSSGNREEPGSSISCWLLEGPRGVKSLWKALCGVMEWLYHLTAVVCLPWPPIKPVRRTGSMEEKQELLKKCIGTSELNFLGWRSYKKRLCRELWSLHLLKRQWFPPVNNALCGVKPCKGKWCALETSSEVLIWRDWLMHKVSKPSEGGPNSCSPASRSYSLNPGTAFIYRYFHFLTFMPKQNSAKGQHRTRVLLSVWSNKQADDLHSHLPYHSVNSQTTDPDHFPRPKQRSILGEITHTKGVSASLKSLWGTSKQGWIMA